MLVLLLQLLFTYLTYTYLHRLKQCTSLYLFVYEIKKLWTSFKASCKRNQRMPIFPSVHGTSKEEIRRFLKEFS